MRKFFSYIIAGLALLSASACVHEQPAVFDPAKGTAPVLVNYEVNEDGVSAQFTPGSVDMDFNKNVPLYHSFAIVELDGAKANKVIPANVVDDKISVSKANLSKTLISMGKAEGSTVAMKLTVRMSLQDPTKDSGLNGFIDSKDQISISSWIVEVPQPQGNPWKDYTEKSTWSVIGAIASTGNSWNQDEPMFSDGSKHVAKNLKLATGDQFKIRNNGSWDDNRGATGEVEPFVITIGEALPAVANGKNLAVPADGSYDLLYDPATETITLSEAFATYPGFDSVSEWSVIGAIASFEMEWNKDIEMSTDGTWHVAEGVELKAADQFKFRKNQDWGDNFGATGDVEPFVVALDTEYEANPGGKNLAVPEDGVYDLLVNPEAKLYKVVATLGGSCHLVGEGGGPDNPQPTFEGWSITGSISGSGINWDGDIDMTTTGSFWVARDVKLATSDAFKFRKAHDWGENIGATGDTEPAVVEIGAKTAGAANGKNLAVPAEGTYDLYLNPDEPSFYVMAAGEVPAEIASWGVVGNITGWGNSADLAMVEENGMLVRKNVALTTGDQFKIRYMSNWDVNRGAPGDTEPFIMGTDAIAATQNGKNLGVAADGNYDVWYDALNEILFVVPAGTALTYWGVVGNITGWGGERADYIMYKSGDFYAVKGIELATDSQFKIRYCSGWDVNRGAPGDVEPFKVDAGSVVEATQNGKNLGVNVAGKYDIYYNAAEEKLYVMGEGNDPSGAVTPEPPTPEKPTAWSIIGTIGGSSWDKDFDLTNTEGDIWKYEGLTVTDTDEFKIRANHDWGTSVGGAEENETSGIDPSNPYNVFKPTIGTAFATGGLNIRIAVAGTYNVTFDYAAKTILIEGAAGGTATIADFAKEYVKILDVWEQNVGKVNRLSVWEPAKDGDEDVVENVHYIPNNTTITVAGKSYTIGDMLETALRSYLLLRGWDGNETEKAGLGNIPTAAPVSMSETAVPETHGFMFNKPLIESSNGGYLVKIVGEQEIHCQVDPLILDNWAQRSLNWPFTHDMLITNFCGYPRDPITNYSGCFSSGRALITYAFFFKYLLDNQLDRADALPNSTVIRSELFGNEGAPAGESNVIKTAEEMLAFLANPTKDVELGANIDLSGANVTPAAEVTGNFDGKGHLITVKLQTPLFLVTRGDVKNVTFGGSFAATAGAEKTVLAPIGKSYGALENVANKATVSLSGPAGQGSAETANGAIAAGVVGEAYGPVKGCSNSGKIAADASGKDTWTIIVAGVAGVVGDAVEGCTNSGEVSLVAGSPLGRTKGLTEVTMKYDPVSSVAGIVTYAVSDANHTVTVTNCENTGKISFTYDALHDKSAAVSRSPVAGIVANSGGDITNCHNKGDIYATMVAPDRSAAYADVNIILHAAGVQGADYFVKKIKSTVDQNETSVINCSNTGNIYADSDMTKSNNTIGGVSAWPSAESASVTVIKDCVNSGNLTIKGKMKIRAGGIAGGTNSIEGCTNSGNILVEGADAASVFGLINGFHTQTHTLKNCQTTGTLESKLAVSALGGICGGVGNAENTICEGCKVNATIIGGGTVQCGLIIGLLNGDTKKVTIGTTESPVTVAGTVNGVKATADNYMTLIHNASKYKEGVHTFNAVYGE